jgi:hypothetical protein
MMIMPRRFLWLFLTLALLAGGCGPGATPGPTLLPTATRGAQATASPAPTRTPSLAPSLTLTPAPSKTPTITHTPEPSGCLEPPDDYSLIEVNGWTLNRRTMAMLEHAARLYGGELEITGYHITQGSYHDNPASFGTHIGGGAVDLSVMRRGTYTVLWDDVEPLIQAMRSAGFAAWLRAYGELSPDSPIHIHAVAVGDRQLSQAAQDQLTGPFGYFRGYTGVPIPDGPPAPDRHGGPLLCQWMIDLGYVDLRGPSDSP